MTQGQIQWPHKICPCTTISPWASLWTLPRSDCSFWMVKCCISHMIISSWVEGHVLSPDSINGSTTGLFFLRYAKLSLSEDPVWKKVTKNTELGKGPAWSCFCFLFFLFWADSHRLPHSLISCFPALERRIQSLSVSLQHLTMPGTAALVQDDH